MKHHSRSKQTKKSSRSKKETGYTRFIKTTLNKRGKMKQSSIDALITPEAMKVFERARTHKSVENNQNYELLEFRGDLILNMAVGEFIFNRWPNYKNHGYITRIKHMLVSGKILGIEAYKAGLAKYALYSSEVQEMIAEDPDPQTNREYRSILEDMLEAFTGAIYKVVSEGTDGPCAEGVAWMVAKNFVCSFMDNMKIDVGWKDIYDAKTRIKELYTRMKWGDINKFLKIRKDEGTGLYTCTIFGYPLGDKYTKAENSVKLASGTGKDKKDLEMTISERALKILNEKYNIKEKTPNPFE